MSTFLMLLFAAMGGGILASIDFDVLGKLNDLRDEWNGDDGDDDSSDEETAVSDLLDDLTSDGDETDEDSAVDEEDNLDSSEQNNTDIDSF